MIIFKTVATKKKHRQSRNSLTFPSIWGGPGAFGVFDDDIEPEIFELDPNALVDVEFNAEEITFELGVLLMYVNGEIKNTRIKR